MSRKMFPSFQSLQSPKQSIMPSKLSIKIEKGKHSMIKQIKEVYQYQTISQVIKKEGLQKEQAEKKDEYTQWATGIK